jgi:hypothetical protein
VKVNVAPFPSLLFSPHILPPWASTIFFEIKSPNPVPFSEAREQSPYLKEALRKPGFDIEKVYQS